MPLLFSYGSLRRAEVQQSTFGRILDGSDDGLPGWQLVPASPGTSPHANIIRATGSSRVSGVAFEVTDAELRAADEYERRDGYVRVTGRLASGRSTWVYVDELSLRDARSGSRQGGSMLERNPYAAPKAPVVSADEPTQLPDDPANFEYGGFWRRVGAQILDGIIMIPMAALLYFLMYKTSRAYLYYALPSIAVQVFYWVYLVRRNGGTPGKRICGMRITMTDGSPVTMKAAVLRYSPFLILQALSMLSMIQATYVPIDGYESMTFLEKIQTQQVGMPFWGKVIAWLTYAWTLVTAITLIANQRKRATHDFIAGTVVLRTD